jgi:hypothetical protein
MASVTTFFLAVYFTISQIDISPDTFFRLNNLFTLLYCLSFPVTLALGLVGITRKTEPRALSWIAIIVIGVPFSVFAWQLVSFLSKR